VTALWEAIVDRLEADPVGSGSSGPA